MDSDIKTDLVVVPTVRRHRGANKAINVHFKITHYKSDCLLSDILNYHRTRVQPYSYVNILTLKNYLSIAGLTAKKILKTRTIDVTIYDIANLFLNIEQSITDKDEWNSMYSISNQIRPCFSTASIKIAEGKFIRDVYANKLFRTRFIHSNSLNARKALTEQIDYSVNPPLPISALPHKNINDLEQKALQRASIPLTRIHNAARRDIRNYLRLYKFQCSVLKSECNPKTKDYFISELDSNNRKYETLIKVSKSTLRTIYLQYAIETLDDKVRSFHGVKLKKLFGKHGESYASSMQWMHITLRLPNYVVFSIFVLLKSMPNFAWNTSALLSLRHQDVEEKNGIFSLRGYKKKSDDLTPLCEVYRSDKIVWSAIQLLLWNHQQLKKLHYISNDEERLWFGWSPMLFDAHSPNHKKKWNSSHSQLPYFSLEQLRNTAATHKYLETHDVEMVRILLGHNDLETTSHYLEQTIIRDLQRAKILEFQKRLEATIVWQYFGSKDTLFKQFDPDKVDPNLLLPLGDGASCSNPKDSPDPKQPKGICEGRFCHVGEGCPNRVIIICQSRVEELIRKKRYYIKRWRHLQTTNKEAFSRFHIPAIIFVSTLESIVKEQRPDMYQRVIDKIEEK